jgi:hypothetical protein
MEKEYKLPAMFKILVNGKILTRIWIGPLQKPMEVIQKTIENYNKYYDINIKMSNIEIVVE